MLIRSRCAPESDQVERWTPSALLLAEEGFNKISNLRDLPGLVSILAAPSAARSRLRSSLAATWRSCCADDRLHSAGSEAKKKPKRGLQDR